MINFDEYINENKRKHNPNWSYIPDHPYRILIIGGLGSGKTNTFDCIISLLFFVLKIFEFKFSVFFLHFTQ